jgi:RNA polymerase sigma-70 factor (ECF subfamily)
MEPQDTVATFEGFVRRTAGKYHTMARSYLRDSHEAEDVVQSAFFKTWRAWGKVQEDPGLEAWVARIIRNECIDRSELQRRFEEHAARETSAGEDTAPSEALADEEHTRDLERARKLIREIPEPYRSVLVLRFVEKLTYKEIARETGKPLGTVKTNLCRGVRLLRLELRKPRGSNMPDSSRHLDPGGDEQPTSSDRPHPSARFGSQGEARARSPEEEHHEEM